MIAKTLVALIRSYKLLISPWLPRCCRFIPTCSEYAEAAIGKHGVFKGLFVSFLRLLRCNPFFPCGHDPVPETVTFHSLKSLFHGKIDGNRGNLN